ncbi:hypothetical protein [Prosthecobacter sp.]|uniref:hypothetical protein n=1 Tax=Prosthecobacter sp. TaxID=1965333 RepID=UPI0037848D62
MPGILLLIFDHGGAAHQEFGSPVKGALDPHSQAWKSITSSVRPKGHIVLVGCEVAKQEWNNRNPDTNKEGRYLAYDGIKYLSDLYYNADGTRAPTIHAYDENVRYREGHFKHAVTAGREHSYETEGYQVLEPEGYRPPPGPEPK